MLPQSLHNRCLCCYSIQQEQKVPVYNVKAEVHKRAVIEALTREATRLRELSLHATANDQWAGGGGGGTRLL